MKLADALEIGVGLGSQFGATLASFLKMVIKGLRGERERGTADSLPRSESRKKVREWRGREELSGPPPPTHAPTPQNVPSY